MARLLAQALLPLAVAGGVGLALPAAGNAAGFGLKEQGALDQGSAYAGATARAEDPTSLFYNPAGITRLDGYQISLNASFIDATSNAYAETASRSPLLGGTPVSGTTDGNIGSAALVPSFFATAAITPNLHVGLSVTSPFGLTSQDNTTSIARYYALTSSLKTFDIAPSIAYRVLPSLSLATSLIVETADAQLSNAVDFGSIGALAGLGRAGLLPGTADGIASVKASDAAVGYQVGAFYEPIVGTRVGLSYRSPIAHKLSGSVTYQGVPTLLATAFPNQSITAKLVTPADASLGVAQDIGRWTLLADVEWTQWSRFSRLAVQFADGGGSATPENWHDSWTEALGVDYRLSDDWTLRAGTALDGTPTANSTRTPRIPDSNRVWLSTGATWKVTKALSISGAYSHLFVGSSSVSLIDAGPGTPNFLRGDLTASYHNSVDIVSLQATMAF
jgi:long-chain fatty acid transport protein